MEKIAKRLNAYINAHPFDSGDSDCKTVLDQLYQAYAESHESDPQEISNGFKELDDRHGDLFCQHFPGCLSQLWIISSTIFAAFFYMIRRAFF